MPNLLDALSDSENTIDLQDENLITPIHEFLEINPEKRLITIPESEQLFGVYGENKVEIKYFKCPRIILNDIDLYECYIFINYISASGRIGYIQADTVVLDETENYIIFTWELTRNVFDENTDADIYFSISAKQYLEDKEPVFFTRKAKGNLYETVYAEEQITEQYADIILQLLAEMDGVKQIATPEAMQEYVNIWLSENPDKLEVQPIPVKSASEMLNTNTIYLYMGVGETVNEVTYKKGYIYYYLEEEQSWVKGSFYGGEGNKVFYIASVSDFAKYENGFDSMTTSGTYFIYPKLAGIADTYPELFTPKDGYTATVAVMEVGTYEEGSTDALHQFMTIYFPVTVNGESTLETMTATRINLGESGMRTWKISKGDLSNIFIAEYGTTTLDEILDALSSGKSCFCNYRNTLMSLISYGSVSVQFGCFSMSNARGESAFYTIVTVNSSGWIKPEVTKYTKTSEISESSTDDEIPTALAVQNTRTHYTENEGQTTVILEETDLGETDDFFTLEQALPFEVGKTYVITWNGTEYECKAKNYAIEGAPFVGVGNASLLSLGKDTGEPFAMGTLDSLTMIAPAGAVEGTSDGTVEPVYVSAVVSIVQIDEVVHKLPNKYLDLEWSPVRKVVLKTLLEETELAIYKADIGIEMPYVGDTVYVTIDGTEYETVTKEIWLNGISGIVFGNPALVNDSLENTGEIFVAWDTGAEVVWICSGTSGVKRTVSIKADVHEYVALPKEFMPTYAIETDLADGVTADELSSANAYFKKGVPVYALVNGTKGKILNLTMYTDDAEHTCSHVWVVVKDKLYNLYYVGSALTNAYEISQTEVTL